MFMLSLSHLRKSGAVSFKESNIQYKSSCYANVFRRKPKDVVAVGLALIHLPPLESTHLARAVPECSET